MLLRIVRVFIFHVLIVLALVGASHRSAIAQWQKVASNLFTPIGVGAMCYSDGYLWLISTNLYLSTDQGLTWTQENTPDPTPNSITFDLQFFDRLTGIAATSSGTFLTRDGGTTWKEILQGSPYSCCFGLTSSIIASASAAPLGISVSTDQGVTWTTRQLVQAIYPLCIQHARDGSILVFSGRSGVRGQIFATTDFGQTWRARGGRADEDSYGFAIDSCDDNRIYLANDDAQAPGDAYSQIFLTTDGAQSWSVVDQHPLVPNPYFTGAIALGYTAIYAPTYRDGIRRSTDRGVTWKSVGGPSDDFDTRFISAITDNVVVVADARGNVWRTTNGGGDSVIVNQGKITLTPSSVVLADTLAPCDAAEKIVIATSIGCNGPSIAGISIFGSDSLAYLLTSGARTDSLIVLFHPLRAGANIATITLHLNNGITLTLPLTGFGAASPTVTMHTNDGSNDTIGGSIYVPIIAESATTDGNLSFHLSYDTSMLEYVGSYSTLNALDGTISRTAGNASVLLANHLRSVKNDTIAYALFHIYPTRDSCSVVTIDSISIGKKQTLCAQSLQVLHSNVCSPVRCGSMLLSQLTRYQTVKHLSAAPNPNSGSLELRSWASLDAATISIVDGLGIERAAFYRTIDKNVPLQFDLHHLPPGAYSAVVHSASGIEAIHFILIR